MAVSEPKLPVEQDETPDDVATLYSWANLHGAKYRDFSATRAQARDEARRRVEEAQAAEARRKQEEEDRRAQEEAQLAARRAAEAAEAARKAEAERLAEIARQAEAERQAVLAAQQAQRIAAQQRAWQPQTIPQASPQAQPSAPEAWSRDFEATPQGGVSNFTGAVAPSSYAQQGSRVATAQAAQTPEPALASPENGYAQPRVPGYAPRPFQEFPVPSFTVQQAVPAGSNQYPDPYAEQSLSDGWLPAEPNDAVVRPAWLATGPTPAAPPVRERRVAREQEAVSFQQPAPYRPQIPEGIPEPIQVQGPALIPNEISSPVSTWSYGPRGSQNSAPVGGQRFGGNQFSDRVSGQGSGYGSGPAVTMPSPAGNGLPGGMRQAMAGQGSERSESGPGAQPGQGAGQVPGQQSGQQSGQSPDLAEDTLAGSRDRMASGWFALKSVFDPQAATVEQAPALAPAKVPVLAVFSLAGGVGKTSLVASLGRALSSRGERVLLVDTAAFGLLPFFFGARDQRPGMLRTFNPPGASNDAPVQLLALDPESPAGDAGGQDWIMQEVLRHSRAASRVLVDLPTASGATTRRVLRLNPSVLVPVVPDMNSVVSVGAIEAFFRNHSNMTGKQTMPYYLLNQFDYSQPLHLDVREILREQIGDRLLPFALRRSAAVSEALAEGMTVMEYAPNANVTEDYASLAGWVRSLSAPANVGHRGVRWSER